MTLVTTLSDKEADDSGWNQDEREVGDGEDEGSNQSAFSLLFEQSSCHSVHRHEQLLP